MGKDVRRKTRGMWWYGWVRYVYTDFDGSEREGLRATDWEFATAGQAQRAAEMLAGGLAAPEPLTSWGKKFRSKTSKRPSRITVAEIGASRIV